MILYTVTLEITGYKESPNKFNLALYGIVWQTLSKTAENVTGYLTETFTQNGTVTDVNIATPLYNLYNPGHLIKFENPT